MFFFFLFGARLLLHTRARYVRVHHVYSRLGHLSAAPGLCACMEKDDSVIDVFYELVENSSFADE